MAVLRAVVPIMIIIIFIYIRTHTPTRIQDPRRVQDKLYNMFYKTCKITITARRPTPGKGVKVSAGGPDYVLYFFPRALYNIYYTGGGPQNAKNTKKNRAARVKSESLKSLRAG